MKRFMISVMAVLAVSSAFAAGKSDLTVGNADKTETALIKDAGVYRSEEHTSELQSPS